jgi:hypothetical protein
MGKFLNRGDIMILPLINAFCAGICFILFIQTLIDNNKRLLIFNLFAFVFNIISMFINLI